MILIIGTPKMAPLILGNPHIIRGAEMLLELLAGCEGTPSGIIMTPNCWY